MKKKISLILLFALLCVICFIVYMSEEPKVKLYIDENNDLMVRLTVNGKEETIYPWFNPSDEKKYFFLPSYAPNTAIIINKSDLKVTMEKSPIINYHLLNWENNMTYELSSDNGSDEQYSQEIVLLKSDNIPAIFIDTESGSMEYLNEDKNNEEIGYISIFESNGHAEYSEKLDRISGRGNSTWKLSKKPYSIKLNTSRALLGMKAGEKWNLLALWYEANKINTKIVFDLATELGLLYTPECRWVDLYLNGEYNGIYLLCKAISVENGSVDINNLEKENISFNQGINEALWFNENGTKGFDLEYGSNTDGGYLIEKDVAAYYDMEKSGFLTNSGHYFSIKSPQHASREQVEYIKEYIQKIDGMIYNQKPDFEHYIDLHSFAARFLVDEISLNFDANSTSMFFYKDKNCNMLFTGPVWDYDLSMGWGRFGDGEWINPGWSILNSPRGGTLNWYQILYSNESFYNQVIREYKKILPYMESVLNSTIDEYAEFIKASVLMDSIRWKNYGSTKAGHYSNFEDNIRYLKYFLVNRLNYLCDIWQIPYPQFNISNSDAQHEIIFICNDTIIDTISVQDGETIMAPPDLDETLYEGWFYSHNDEIFSPFLPVYSDYTLYAK